jgi:hypothetical protein
LYTRLFFHTGEASKLSSSDLKRKLEAAETEAREQHLRNPRSYGSNLDSILDTTDPDTDSIQGEATGMANLEICKLLPHLGNVPEDTLRKLPLSAIFQLSNALAKSSKATDKLSLNSRLAANAQGLMKAPTKVHAGEDNRRTVLHEARFLGGACCTMNDIWLRGKEVIGPKGPTPVSCYDLDAVGCGGSVTARGWKELHDPSSQELKIKHFYLPNVAGHTSTARKVTVGDGEEISLGESMKEISDLEGFKGALNVLREAMASALPWNRSVSALCGYMCNTNYLQVDLSNNPKRAAILSEFTDYILGRNALNWDNGHPFITTDEMAHVWSNWKGKRTSLFTSTSSRDKDSKSKDKKYQTRNDVCRKFNVKVCTKQTDKECANFFGTKLKHICNKFVNGGICGKDHARLDHV